MVEGCSLPDCLALNFGYAEINVAAEVNCLHEKLLQTYRLYFVIPLRRLRDITHVQAHYRHSTHSVDNRRTPSVSPIIEGLTHGLQVVMPECELPVCHCKLTSYK